jgi:ATP-dependent Clp protease adaptor protein ClpS
MKEKPIHKDDKLQEGSKIYSLILFNDDINTFDHVIKLLVEVCGHDIIQAEQCALLVHFRGSYEVKKGPVEILTAMNRSLNAGGLISAVSLL